MPDKNTIRFIDNPSLNGSMDKYIEIHVQTNKVLESWKHSLFSFEWLDKKGKIKRLQDLPDGEQSKRRTVEERIERGEPLAKPVLGIGIYDNVEIGVGRAEFLTLITHGVKKIPVHIPKSSESDFHEFLADVS